MKKARLTSEHRRPTSAEPSASPFEGLWGGGSVQGVLEAQQRNVEMLRKLSDLMVGAIQGIATQQVAAAKTLTDRLTNGAGNLFGARAPEEWGAAQAEFLRTWVDTWFAQAQVATETGCRSCIDAAQIINQRCTEAASECRSMIGAVGASR